MQARFGVMIPVLGALALSACAAPSPSKPATGASFQQTAYTPAPETAMPEQAAPPGPAAPNHSGGLSSQGPESFDGLAGAEVLASLGDPNFRRHEEPAEVWQYYGPGCILDLFLYRDAGKADGSGTVAYADLRGRPGQPAEAACLTKLIDQRHRQKAEN